MTRAKYSASSGIEERLDEVIAINQKISNLSEKIDVLEKIIGAEEDLLNKQKPPGRGSPALTAAKRFLETATEAHGLERELNGILLIKDASEMRSALEVFMTLHSRRLKRYFPEDTDKILSDPLSFSQGKRLDFILSQYQKAGSRLIHLRQFIDDIKENGDTNDMIIARAQMLLNNELKELNHSIKESLRTDTATAFLRLLQVKRVASPPNSNPPSPSKSR